MRGDVVPLNNMRKADNIVLLVSGLGIGIILLYLFAIIPGFSTASIRITSHPFSNSHSASTKCSLLAGVAPNDTTKAYTGLSNCGQWLVDWISKHPPSNYKYYDKYLNFFDLYREFNITHYEKSGISDVKRAARDLGELLKCVYLRGQNDQAVSLAAGGGILDKDRINDPEIRAVVSAIEYGEFFEQILLNKSRQEQQGELIEEIQGRFAHCRRWLEDYPDSFLFLNTLAQGYICLIYISIPDLSFQDDAMCVKVNDYILKADELLFRAYNSDNIRPYLAGDMNTNAMTIYYADGDITVDSTSVDITKLKNSGDGPKLRTYLNNRCELLNWHLLLTRECSADLDTIPNRLTKRQIKRFGDSVPDLVIADEILHFVQMGKVHSYITLAEHYSLQRHYAAPADTSRLAKTSRKYLRETAKLISTSNLDHFERKELVNYINCSRFMRLYFEDNPHSFADMVNQCYN